MGKSLIKVDCIDQRLSTSVAPVIASGGRNEDEVEFNFCPLWDGFEKTAVFYRRANVVYHVAISENRCIIPHEVLVDEGWMYFGVFGVKDDVTRTSEILKYNIVKGAITENTVPSDPTPDIYSQYVNRVAELVKSKANALVASESGEMVTIWPDEGSPIDVVTDGTTVTRCGKNLIPYPYEVSSKTVAGVTITDNGDGSLTFNGTSTDGGWYHLFAADLDICDTYMATNASTAYTDVGLMMSVSDVAVSGLSLIYYGATNKRLTIKITAANVTFDNVTIYPMIEAGKTKTEWEPYQAESFDVADGAISISAISGPNNIFSDGTSVEATYNKSIAKTVEELTNAIISLGGNV